MNAESLSSALAALERSSTPTVVSHLRRTWSGTSDTFASMTPSYASTPSVPRNWQPRGMSIEEEDVPLNLGAEKDAGDEDAPWTALAFEPRRARVAKPPQPLQHDRLADTDCGICLQPALDPCVTRCGHVFCDRDLQLWFDANALQLQCPVCSAVCIPERDVAPVVGVRGRSAQRLPSASVPRPALDTSTTRTIRSRRTATRSLSRGLSASDGDLPSLTASSQQSERASPTHSGTSTPARKGSVDEPFDDIVAPVSSHLLATIIPPDMGRPLSLLAFLALLFFLSK